MARSVWPKAFSFIALLSLAGCGWMERAERPAWRTQAENLCLARGLVKPSAYITPMREIDGPSICGMTHPFKVSALADGTIPFDKPVVIDCSMIPALEEWLNQVVQPYAQARFGAAVVGLDTFGAYSCRGIDNMAGARLSEHAFGNAIDVSGFKLADGREITLVRDWKKTDSQESAFLHEVHAGACQRFTTVLGPGADPFHYNHLHLDLAMHGATNTGPRRYCKPQPPPDLLPPPPRPDGLPPAPDIEEPMDVARATLRPSAPPLALDGPSAALPPPVETYDERDPAPPILPAEDGAVDTEPTSAIPLSHDD
ncbi:MAG TPA: extensin family protein [Roseiarcus sp.]